MSANRLSAGTIDLGFRAGMEAAIGDWNTSKTTNCPYPENATLQQWWQRGYRVHPKVSDVH